MLDHLKPGVKIKAYGPNGIFTSHKHPARKYLFISAGSGITPMMSMTTWAWDSGEMPDIVFVHAARRPSDIIFRPRLEQFAARVPGLQLRFTVEEVEPFSVWHGFRGRLNQIMLGLMAPDYLEREVFCCGPEPFMRAVKDSLAALGFEMTRYHQESFGPPETAPEPVPEAASEAAEITFTASGVSTACAPGETVLAVAKRAGLNISSGCNFGLCGTCKVKKTAGEVQMLHNGGISEDDIAAGYILACCSRPAGKVAVEI
jgi:ferredoxin-NADP reductase